MPIWKQVLAPGIYWTQEGPVKFTAADCAKLVSTGKEMRAAGLSIPVPLEHQDLRPVDQATRLANTVLHNAGWVEDYKLEKDNSAWAKLDIADPALAKRLPQTVKFVSPEIDRFTDGTGRDWGRVITHVALTTQPVDASQEPFRAGDGASAAPTNPTTVQAAAHALRWSLAKGPLRFSLASAVRLSRGRWTAIHPEQVRLSGAAMPKPPEKPEELETEEPEIPETEGTEKPEAKPEPPGSADTGHFGEALKVLEEHGIKLPPSTSPENFFERLCVAGHCLRDQPDETPEEPEKPETTMTQKTPQEEPQAVAMSLKKKDDEIGRLQAELAEERFKGVSKAIDDLVGKGQIPVVKAKAWREKLGAKRLSLVQGNDTGTREILAQIELAKEIPDGTFWSPEDKTARLSRSKAQPEEAPEYVRFDRDEDLKNMPAERVKKIADEAFGPA